MNLTKKTKILKLNIEEDKRIIFMSDIHGDVDTLKQALKKVNYIPNEDYLFLIGDIIEKGALTKNLETIRYVMGLTNYSNVYVMAGNCDEVFRFILQKDSDQKFLYYTLKKKHSILNDMAHEMHVEIKEDMNVREFIDTMYNEYIDIILFLDNLIDVIYLNGKMVLVHGGINDIFNIPFNSIDVLKYDCFYMKSPNQPKLMVVGHYPTRNYRKDISCCNPIFDFKKKIISIDGGNQVCTGGQINVVMLKSLSSMAFSYTYVDHYPKHIMKCDVKYDKPINSCNIVYGDNEIEILDTNLDFFFIKHKETNEAMWVHNSFVYQAQDGKLYCYDGSNQFLSVNKNDEISIIIKAQPYSVIKKDGYIGLIETRYIEDDF